MIKSDAKVKMSLKNSGMRNKSKGKSNNSKSKSKSRSKSKSVPRKSSEKYNSKK